MTIKTLIGAAGLVIASLSTAQPVVPEGTVPARASKSRTEVLAEFSLWRRAGLDRYNAEGADQSTLDYQQRMAQYARMRNGPQYVAELQRIQAGQAQHAAAQARQGG